MSAKNVGILCLISTLVFTSLATAFSPREPNKKLLAAAPEKCLFYFHRCGVTATDPQATSKTEQLMLEPTVQEFGAEVESLIDQGLQAILKEASEDDRPVAEGWIDILKRVIDRPMTFYLADVEVGPYGPEDIEAAFVIDAGDKIDDLFDRVRKLEKAMDSEGIAQSVQVSGIECRKIQGSEDEPPFFWGKSGKYLILSVGEDSVKNLVSNIKSPAPAWLVSALKRNRIPRLGTFTWMNVNQMFAYANENMDSEDFQKVEATGWADIRSFSGAIGLDQDGLLSRSFIETDSNRGALAVFEKNGISTGDLERIPQDVVSAAAFRFSLSKTLGIVLNMMGEIEPEAREQFEAQMASFRDQIGLDIQNELLAGLGDRILTYSVPGQAGPVPNIVVAIDVKNPSAIQKGLKILADFVNQREGNISITETNIGDRAAYYLKGIPATPTWCLTKDRLVIAAQKPLIAGFLDSPPPVANSLANHPKIQALLKDYQSPFAVTYSDSITSMSGMYQALPMLLNMASGFLDRQDIDFDVTTLPPIGDVTKHLDPAVSIASRSEDGIEFVARQTMPSVGASPATTGILVALLLPAVQQARTAARRNQSINNLRQIGLAALNYESALQRFPSAKYGKDGNAGLSWRVAILPFIEEQELYEQFHLDEPWDSEHNRQLIDKMPAIFCSPHSGNSPEDGKTNYVAIGRPDAVISGAGEGVKIRQIKDGTSRTILAVEVDDEHAVAWTSPEDFAWNPENPQQGLGGGLPSHFLAVFADCHVQAIEVTIDAETLEALVTRDGGEPVTLP